MLVILTPVLITNSSLWMQTTTAKCTQSGNFKGSAEMVSGMALSWFENVCRAFLVAQTKIFSGTKYVLAASWSLLRGQSHPGAISYPQSISRELMPPTHCSALHKIATLAAVIKDLAARSLEQIISYYRLLSSRGRFWGMAQDRACPHLHNQCHS